MCCIIKVLYYNAGFTTHPGNTVIVIVWRRYFFLLFLYWRQTEGLQVITVNSEVYHVFKDPLSVWKKHMSRLSLRNLFHLWYIEDITWPRGDMKSLFECWNIFSIRDTCRNTKPFHFNSFWCKRSDLFCSHSNGDIFTCEDNMLFWHAKISSFARKLTWYFIGVYKIILLTFLPQWN